VNGECLSHYRPLTCFVDDTYTPFTPILGDIYAHEVDLAPVVSSVQSYPPSPLQVLAATWNVGNAMPPPPEQLQTWLKGAAE
jgi:hypothetical protein